MTSRATTARASSWSASPSGARSNDCLPGGPLTTDYVNTISAAEEPAYPGDRDMERRIRRIIRWNSAAMVVRANTNFPGLGGHMSTFASAASLYDVGFNHFFKGPEAEGGGDQVYFQGHASPGIYARSYLEGASARISSSASAAKSRAAAASPAIRIRA